MLGNWVKFPTEILNNPRYGNLPPRLWRLAAELRLIKGMKPQDPILPTIEEIQWKIHAPDIKALSEDLEALRKIGILDHDGQNLLYPNLVEEGEADSPKVRQSRHRENERLSRSGNDQVTNRVLEREEVERSEQDKTRAEEDTESAPAASADLFGDLAKRLKNPSDSASDDLPDDTFWEKMQSLRPELCMEQVRAKLENFCRTNRISMTREYAEAWFKREKLPMKATPLPKPQKPKVDVAFEEKGFRWRSKKYPDSILIHPTWNTFPFKDWPKSTQKEFLDHQKKLRKSP
jgi:hypothetical protein